MALSKHCHTLDFTSLREVTNRSQSTFNLHASAYMLSLCLVASQRTIAQLYFIYLWRSPHWTDVHENLCSVWCSRRNHMCQVSKWNFQGLQFYRRSNFSFFLLILNGPYNSAALLRCLWCKNTIRISTLIYSPVDLGFDPGEICTKLENGSYDAEFNGEQHIKSPRKSPLGKFFRGQNSKWRPKNL